MNSKSRSCSGETFESLAWNYGLRRKDLLEKENPFIEVYERQKQLWPFSLVAFLVLVSMFVVSVICTWWVVMITAAILLLAFISDLCFKLFMYPKLRKWYKEYPRYREDTLKIFNDPEYVMQNRFLYHHTRPPGMFLEKSFFFVKRKITAIGKSDE